MLEPQMKALVKAQLIKITRHNSVAGLVRYQSNYSTSYKRSNVQDIKYNCIRNIFKLELFNYDTSLSKSIEYSVGMGCHMHA